MPGTKSYPLWPDTTLHPSDTFFSGGASGEEGKYRYAQEILNKLVYAEPQNQEAKDLLADVFEQIGIDPEEAFGYKVVEPILQLRKPAVRVVARALGLRKEISERPPFPGPALCARNQRAAAAGGLSICSGSIAIPIASSLRHSSERGREEVLVRKRCGIASPRIQAMTSAAPSIG